MKIVNSLTCFLIAGILSSVHAREDMESSCAKNGGARAFDNLQAGAKEVEMCFTSVASDWAREVQKSNGEMDTAFALYCDRVGDLKNCAQRFKDLIKICLEPEQHEFIDVAYNMAVSLVQFGCDNSKLLIDAAKSQDMPCLSVKLNAMQPCADLVTAARNITIPKNSATGMNPLGTLSKLKLRFADKECREIQKAEECAVNKLAECQDQKFSQVLDTLYKYINNNIPCENLPKSAASPASVANILLSLLPVIAMSL